MGKPRLGLVGLMHMGREHYTNLIRLVVNDRITLAALCDTDERALELPSVKHDVAELDVLLNSLSLVGPEKRLSLLHQKMQQVAPSLPSLYTDYETMLDEAKLDGVIIVTPNFLHRRMTELALAHDISALVEKPMAPTVAECHAIMEAERKSKGFVQVGLHMRYRVIHHAIKKILEERELGDLVKLWCQEFRGDWHPHGTPAPDASGTKRNWRLVAEASGGAMIEKLCHDFDLFTWWADSKPVRVSAFGGNGAFKDRETIDHADIVIAFENEVKANISMTMFSPNKRFKGRYIGAIGDRGLMDYDNMTSDITLYFNDGRVDERHGLEPRTAEGFHPGNATDLELEHFVRCIDEGLDPIANSRVGLRSIIVGEAAEQSARENRTVEITEW